MRHIVGRRTDSLGLLGDPPIPGRRVGGAALNMVVRSPFKPMECVRKLLWGYFYLVVGYPGA